MPDLLEKPKFWSDEEIADEVARKRKYCVLALNNDTTGYNEVLKLLMTYCGYQFEQADHYTREIHQMGKAVVYWESKEKCDGLVKEFKNIRVTAETKEN